MNKYLFLIFAILVISGCSQETICNKPYILVGNDCCLDANDNNICDSDEQEQKETIVEEITSTEEIEEEPMPEPVEEVTPTPEEQEMEDSVKELLTKAKTKVKSYSYTYFGPPNEAKGIDFTYKANVLKVDYSSIQRDERQNPYYTVYLYLDSKNAAAYCEKIGSCDNPDLEIKVNFDEHYKTMPFEILDSIIFAVETGTERIDNRDAMILDFWDNSGSTGEISIDKFWGMPLKIIYKEPESYKIEYRSMAVNSVEDSDITH